MAGWELGRCEVIRRLGPGESPSFLALRQGDDGDGALVVLEPVTASASQARQRALKVSLVRHPHLARVFDCEVVDEDVFWVTELVAGASLTELAAACWKNGRALPLGVCLSAVHEAALALEALKSAGAFVHVRAEDIFVTVAGDAKLLSRADGEGAWGADGLTALGGVLYTSLTGEALPLPHLPPSRFNVTVTQALDDVVLRALKPSNQGGYRGPGELASALRRAAGEYMWREPQRAQLVANLFPDRARRAEVLLAASAEPESEPATPRPPPLPARRAQPSPRLAMGTPRFVLHASPDVPLSLQPDRRAGHQLRDWAVIALACALSALFLAKWIQPSDVSAVRQWARGTVPSK
jgi:hypothetical protein